MSRIVKQVEYYVGSHHDEYFGENTASPTLGGDSSATAFDRLLALHHERERLKQIKYFDGTYQDEDFGGITVAPTLGGDPSAAALDRLLASHHGRDRKPGVRKRPERRRKNDQIAMLKEDLADMEATLAEERRKSQKTCIDLFHAKVSLGDVRHELTQEKVRVQNMTDTLQTLHSDMQAQSKTLKKRAQANISLQQQLQRVEVEKQKGEAELEIQRDIEVRMNVQLQAKESQLQQVRAAQQEAEAASQKLEAEKEYLASKTRKLEEELADLKNFNGKMLKEQRVLDERLSAIQQALINEEEKSTNLIKLTAKNDAIMVDLEERLSKETKLRQEADKYTRKIETELNDVKERIYEKQAQVEALQQQICKREEKLSHALIRCDEEVAAKAEAQKLLRETKNQLVEFQDVLESEKVARATAEKQKRELNEGLEALKQELSDALDTAATQQELSTIRELELAMLNKTLADASTSHEMQIADIRQEHKRAMEELNAQLDDWKKTKYKVNEADISLDEKGSQGKSSTESNGETPWSHTACAISLRTPCPEKIFPNVNLKEGPTPLLQLMNKHDPTPTVTSNRRKARAAAGRPEKSSSSVTQKYTGTVVNSKGLQHEIQFCGPGKNHCFEKLPWLLWIFWMLYAVVNSEVWQQGMQLWEIGKRNYFEKPLLDRTPVKVTRKHHLVFPRAYTFNRVKTIHHISSEKPNSNDRLMIIIMFLLMFPAKRKPPKPTDQQLA